MKRAELGQVVRVDGEVYEVVTLGEGRNVGLRPVGGVPCRSCGVVPWLHYLEHSPLFQQKVQPVDTIKENP